MIKWLEKQDPSYIVTHGFGEPASYRGNYADVAFVPKENVTFGSMLAHAKSALNSTFSGYKGGQYTMHEYVEAYIAEYGECTNADRIGLTMMKLWEENAKCVMSHDGLS
ncbi:MAG: hypothetical protein KGJ90_06985 [Patescibacteria group bacterium]|nr:hypothetical protein [Patescibacteria group bacterium]